MKILLPVDGSPAALAAVRHALALVDNGLRAEFVLLNVQEPPSLYEVVVAHDAQKLDDIRRSAGADLLHPAEVLLDEAEVGYVSEVVGGSPANVILDVCEQEGCDAIFLGARDADAADAGGLGKVAQAVASRSPVPVAVVRPAASPEVDDEGEPDSGGS
jgi:nucleotide-binding universal stress UspA family protein